MRVLPWNLNQGLPLASSKQQQQQKESRRCCSFFCSWCASTGPDGSASTSIKVEAFHPSSNCQRVDGSSMGIAPPASSPISAPVGIAGAEAVNGKNAVMKVCLKSNLKKPCSSAGTQNTSNPNGSPNRVNTGNDADANPNRKRKVQWTDTHGKELVEIREFELRYTQITSHGKPSANSELCTLISVVDFKVQRLAQGGLAFWIQLLEKTIPVIQVDQTMKTMESPIKVVHVLFSKSGIKEFLQKLQRAKALVRNKHFSAMLKRKSVDGFYPATMVVDFKLQWMAFIQQQW